MSCNHRFTVINDVRVCQQCGLTVTPDNRIIFDRKFPTYKPKKRKKRGKK